MPDQADKMRRIAEMYRRPKKPYIITVTSGKGGVGKSTIALNLALTFCSLGKKVTLLDADANLGGLDVMLKVSPRFRLADVLRGDVDVEDAMITPRKGLKILAGSSGEVDYPLMSAEAQGRLLDDLLAMEEQCDILLIDTSAGLTPEVIQFAEPADETLIVTTTEPTAVLDAYAMMKILWSAKGEAVVNVVVNAARLPQEAEETVRRLRVAADRFLKRTFGYPGFIPFDPFVHKAIVQQEPLMTRFPRSAAALSLQSIARALAVESMSTPSMRAATV
ncbi:MAG TPA: P-loop NTPase [Bacteroidota bacterium]|nr:P-loop NTPase [Bacteroidota bacterium]